MKYTIEGFSQPKLVELKMDLIDAVILRWFIDFKDTGKMYSEIIENDKYYWIKYDQVIEDLPIISLVKTSLGKRVRRLAEIGVLKHHTKKQNGTFSLYAIGENYAPLIDFEIKKEEKELDFDEIKGIKKPKGVPQNEQGVFLEMNKGCSSEGTTNNSSIKITNLLNKTEKTEEPVSDVLKTLSFRDKIKIVLDFEKISLDENFITELTNKFDYDTLVSLIKLIPKDSKNHGGYLRGILKNSNSEPKTKEPKTSVELPKEKPKQTKKSKDEIVTEFLKETGYSMNNLPNFQKNILNGTLKRSGYEIIE